MLQVLHELWDFCHLFYYIVYRGGNLVCTTPSTPIDGFFHSYTVANMTVKIGFSDATSYTWIMGLSVYLKIHHNKHSIRWCTFVRKLKVNPLHYCITIVLGKELFMEHVWPTCLSVPESGQKYYSKVYILQILKENCRIERYTYCLSKKAKISMSPNYFLFCIQYEFM